MKAFGLVLMMAGILSSQAASAGEIPNIAASCEARCRSYASKAHGNEYTALHFTQPHESWLYKGWHVRSNQNEQPGAPYDEKCQCEISVQVCQDLQDSWVSQRCDWTFDGSCVDSGGNRTDCAFPKPKPTEEKKQEEFVEVPVIKRSLACQPAGGSSTAGVWWSIEGAPSSGAAPKCACPAGYDAPAFTPDHGYVCIRSGGIGGCPRGKLPVYDAEGKKRVDCVCPWGFDEDDNGQCRCNGGTVFYRRFAECENEDSCGPYNFDEKRKRCDEHVEVKYNLRNEKHVSDYDGNPFEGAIPSKKASQAK